MEPEIRAAAAYALANLDDQVIIEGLAEFLYDPSHGTRLAATEALLWNTDHRWPWIRAAVRRCLSDPACQQDGALRLEGRRLAPAAVSDLTGWSSEKGCLAVRAALTLGVHYGQVLAAGRDPELNAQLLKQLTDPHAPAVLRLVFAPPSVSPSRTERRIAAKTTGAVGSGARAADGGGSVDGGREFARGCHSVVRLARLPNREIALAVAEVVQRRLGVDMGLTRGQATPPVQSRMAAEVTRRVLAWAGQHERRRGRRMPEARTALGMGLRRRPFLEALTGLVNPRDKGKLGSKPSGQPVNGLKLAQASAQEIAPMLVTPKAITEINGKPSPPPL